MSDALVRSSPGGTLIRIPDGQPGHDPKRLWVALETLFTTAITHCSADHLLATMAEWGMTEIVCQTRSLHNVRI